MKYYVLLNVFLCFPVIVSVNAVAKVTMFSILDSIRIFFDNISSSSSLAPLLKVVPVLLGNLFVLFYV